ncbi:MAG: N-acetyltransferase [Woeseiaceae bacterium]|nr:N-acetyltransferase [Woeseiaceae bacterium]
MQIRDSTSEEYAAILAMYPHAFPDEDLVPLVTELLADKPIRMSLVATGDNRVIGNVIFTACRVDGSDAGVALLAPLAVTPDCQRQGVGSALVHDGLRRLGEAGYGVVCVLGDPAYYGRLGFAPEKRIEPPYPIPAQWADAWQSLYLADMAALEGKFLVPPVWQHPELWTN